jgi:hypothetical protein
VQQTVIKPSGPHLDPLGQHEGALELPRGDAAMQEYPPLHLLILLALDHQLIIFDGDLEIVHAEPGNRQRDTQFLRPGLLDIIRRITIGAGFTRALEQLLKMIEAEK